MIHFCIYMFFLGIIDFVYQKRKFMQKMRMTKYEVKKVVTIKKTVKIQVSLRLIAKFIVDVTAKEKKVYYKYVNLQTSSHKVNIHDVNDIMDNILIELDDIILREGNTNTPTEKIGKSGWKLHRYFNLTVDFFPG